MIIFPAGTATILSGIGMLFLNKIFLEQTWLWLKLLLVLALLIYQFFSYWTYSRFLKRDFFLSERYCRIINEVPTLLLIAIALLVVIKPWQ